MNFIRQEKLIKTFISYRYRKHDIGEVKVEVYDTFQNNKYMCRLEIFKDAIDKKSRLFKFEDFLDDDFLIKVDRCLKDKLTEYIQPN